MSTDLYRELGLNPTEIKLEEKPLHHRAGLIFGVIARHLPTGITISISGAKSQCENREEALRVLTQNLSELAYNDQTVTIVERDRLLAMEPPLFDCPECGPKGSVKDTHCLKLKSVVVYRFEEEGRMHFHDPNLRWASYQCDCGHQWKRYWRSRCWCGWGRSGLESDPKTPVDPAFIHLQGPLVRRPGDDPCIITQQTTVFGVEDARIPDRF